jgi:hypothetical protein
MVDIIIPLENNYKIFLGENNPEYGKCCLVLNFIKKVNSYPEYDNWSSDMELDMAYAGIYGKLSDLSLFSLKQTVSIIKLLELLKFMNLFDIPLRFKLLFA